MQLELLPENNGKLIVSVFDYTGEWAKPYVEAGYPVLLWDLKCEGDILEGLTSLMIMIEEIKVAYPELIVYGFLFAPPCTHFSVSGARWWPMKDKPKPGYEPFDSETELSIALAEICLHLVDIYKDELDFWVLENPVGRLEELVPAMKPFRKLLFNPCDFGDPYTKKTILWGQFNTKLKRSPVPPVVYELRGKKGSYMWAKLGGMSERTKTLRSATPAGFSKAFFEANQ